MKVKISKKISKKISRKVFLEIFEFFFSKFFWKFFKKNFQGNLRQFFFSKNFRKKIFKNFQKKNFIEIFFEIFFWNFYFQKNLKTSSESYEPHLSNARNHNYYECTERTKWSKEAHRSSVSFFRVERVLGLPQNFFLIFLDLELYPRSHSPPSVTRCARPCRPSFARN